ncbi:MAG TPA: aldose 1-epimerase family protein [Thermoleophilaceae bacterium]|nr:aldose 1-epimerase family protein [Thermoleophilaceae bacterium]
MAAYGHMQQLGGTRLVTLEDGSERGVRAVEFRTTTGLDFAVLVDRAMDVGWFRHNGRSIAWHSPAGFTGPWYREVNGLGWLRTFGGGLLTTCGLDHILNAETDPNDTYLYPDRTSTSYGLHGRVANTPAILRSHGERWEGERCILYAEGEVVQAGALAEHLRMTRRIEVDLDGRAVSWTDVVTNLGHLPTPHMYLYHINFGAPLVGPSTSLHAPIRNILFATDTARGGPGEHLEFPAPRADFAEQAFSHAMTAGSDGVVPVLVQNSEDPKHPWGVVLRYSAQQFRYFFQWRYLAAGTYVLGLEPSTNGFDGRDSARADGELIILEPGDSRTYRTELEVVDGAQPCADARLAVERLATDVSRSNA